MVKSSFWGSKPRHAMKRTSTNTWLSVQWALWTFCIWLTQVAGAETGVVVPHTAAGQVLKAWLEAYNGSDEVVARDYIKNYDPDAPLTSVTSGKAQTGGYELLSIEGNDQNHISFVVRQKRNGTREYGSLFVSSDAHPRVLQLGLEDIPAGDKVEKVLLDEGLRQAVIKGIVADLQEFYVDPSLGEVMVAMLEKNESAGSYSKIADGDVFADRLTRDLRGVSHDRHVGVDFHPFSLPPNGSEADESRFRAELEQKNCFFEKVEVQPGNVGYLKFNAFMPPALCGRTLVSAMGFVAHTRALIFDLRDNGGGDPAMVSLVASYLFKEATHLNDLYTRKGNTTRQFWTVPLLEGTVMSTQPVFILTSAHTFSGAEEFSYDLKMQKRAAIIGETTAGGAHPVAGHALGKYFDVGVPWGKAINPISGTSWEGTGVEPDTRVPANDALSTAQRLASEGEKIQ